MGLLYSNPNKFLFGNRVGCICLLAFAVFDVCLGLIRLASSLLFVYLLFVEMGFERL